jgi:hypothetical protein
VFLLSCCVCGSSCRHLRRSLILDPQDNTITFVVRQPPKVLRRMPDDI